MIKGIALPLRNDLKFPWTQSCIALIEWEKKCECIALPLQFLTVPQGLRTVSQESAQPDATGNRTTELEKKTRKVLKGYLTC